MRDWQWRSTQWLAGKAFDATTPVGPWLVTPDEVDHAADLALRCEVDGQVMQSSRTSDLLFTPADLVAYISQFTTLHPGDLIATGTPGGVGAARSPKVFLQPGQVLRTVIEGIGECVNRCVAEQPGTVADSRLAEQRR
jgi:acylpyruvate hydrolase